MLFLVVALHKQRRSDVHRDLYSLHRFLGDDVHIVSTVMVSVTVCDMCDVRDMRGETQRHKKTETQGGIDIPLRLRFFVCLIL